MVVAGDLTNSQTVREIGEQIAADWGALDTVILNAGTCEYIDARQFDASIVEHVVRTTCLPAAIASKQPCRCFAPALHRIWSASPVR